MLAFRPDPPKKPHSKHRHSHYHSHQGKVKDEGSDREREMITNRLVLIIITLSISLWLDAGPELMLGFQLHFLASLAIFIAYRLNPRSSSPRRIAGLLTDFGAGVYLFEIGGGSVAALYPLYLWVMLGYGFRFGLRWLAIATGLGTLSFAWTVYSVEFWQENRSLAIGLLLGLIVIPGYCSTLITKISRATEQAESANKAKSLFLASISHELRTPLNAIIGYGTHLLDMGLPQAQKQMVGTSVSAGQHLLHLINQLLDFARSDSQEELPEPKQFSIIDIMTEVRDIMQIAADEKDLQIHLQAETMTDRPIKGQLDYIRNILINLSSNAIKFTDTGHILLTCGFDDVDGQTHLWCRVTDTGPGIAKEAHEKIFGVFQQADDTISNNFGGTGLGLAICRQLAVQMGGNISLESELGKGSSFTVTCPIETVSTEEASAADQQYRILSIGLETSVPNISGNGAESCEIIHHVWQSDQPLPTTVTEIGLEQFDIALIDERIAELVDKDPQFWSSFQQAELPPVLVSHQDERDLEDIQLRAAFASVLPASPDFDNVRSAIEIGCSFHRKSVDDSAADKQERSTISRQILIADDNRTNRMVLSTILTNAGHRVVAVDDGEEALDALERDQYDLVFLDVNMPKIDGIECCQMWRQIEGPRNHTPIIGLTADSTAETEQKCLDAGMDLRLTKPIEASLLLDTVAVQTDSEDDATNAAMTDRINDPFGTISAIHSTPKEPVEAPVDLSQLSYLQSIGDEAFVRSVIDAYVDDMSTIMTAFETAVSDGNITEFRFHAHAFKSGANNVGATQLAKMCGKLEVLTEPEFEDRRDEYLQHVQQEVARVERFLNDPELLGASSEPAADSATGT